MKPGRSGKMKNADSGRPSPLPLIIMILVVVLLLVAGYMASNRLGSEDTGESSSVDYVEDGDGAGGGAPSFVLVTTEGERVDSRDLRGRVVVLDLMATWCGPCAYQIEELKDVRARYSTQDVVVISVDVDPRESASQLKEYRESKGADWDFCTSTEDFRENYPAEAIPTLYILDRNFQIHRVYEGAQSSEVLSAAIDEVL